MSTVCISGWRIGAKTISAVTELRSCTALGQLGAKNVIYDVIGGVRVDVMPLQGVDSEVLAARLTECGFVATVHSSNEEADAEVFTEDPSVALN